MSVRRETADRRHLVRTCGTCGKIFSTTADSPWMRSIVGKDGRQRITYYCCSSCYQQSYKKIGWYDGKADIRREEKEKKHDQERDMKSYNKAYYEKNRDRILENRRNRYYNNHEEELENNAYSRAKRKAVQEEEGSDMIVIKTRLRTLPKCCRKCPYYDCMGGNKGPHNEGACNALGYMKSTAGIHVSNERLPNCPLRSAFVKLH